MQISICYKRSCDEVDGGHHGAIMGAHGWQLSLVKLPNNSLKIRECMDYPVTLGHGRYYIDLLFCVRIWFKYD